MKRKERNREQIGSNNSDSNPPEAAIGSATIDNDAPRTELEQDKIQRENWSFQFGEYETCEASGGKGRDNMGNGNEDGEAVAEKDGEKQVEEEAEKNGTKEAEKDGAKEAETTPEDTEGEEEAAKEAYEVAGNEDEVGQKEGETEADKEGETEEGKTDVEDSPWQKLRRNSRKRSPYQKN
ncbi:hypothetical protein Bca52824_065522 [Brassica carinata]|uniref:Uncharacterized protein n=1 Tax=Brassica carinata TaxID=52824 RepID=A0A8X7QIX5_BRACI|nr:hypothetical protein Bca52824_065522 [Brassica carinata]